MKVDRVNDSVYNSAFGAHIANTTTVAEVKSYFARHGEVAKEKLLSKIEQAIEKHPSDTFIFSETRLRYGQKHTISGMFYNSKNVHYNDNAVSDNNITAFTKALRNFLRPKNKDKFNAVVGEQYAEQYTGWWSRNMLPLWKDVKALF